MGSYTTSSTWETRSVAASPSSFPTRSNRRRISQPGGAVRPLAVRYRAGQMESSRCSSRGVKPGEPAGDAPAWNSSIAPGPRPPAAQDPQGVRVPMAEPEGVPRAGLPRQSDYAPLREYAAIGDGRTIALVARGGSIDWLCLPDLDSAPIFDAILDAGAGGRFALCPASAFDVTRRYVAGTNVLETTFRTGTGVVRITDAMTLPTGGLSPYRELILLVEPLAGSVVMRWELVPRFGWGVLPTTVSLRAGIPVATQGADAVALCSWGVGEPELTPGSISGQFEAAGSERALFVLSVSHQEPLVFPSRRDVEARLAGTITFWREWSNGLGRGHPLQAAIVSSALVLKLLVYAPSGAIAAAATTSLPETIGGERNWDHRFSWVRDSAFALDALLRLGHFEEADAFFWWLMHASQLTHPRLRVFYRLDGGARAPERTVRLPGYRDSRPVRIGNGAAGQLQLDVYGDLFQAAWLYAEAGRPIDADIGRRLAEIADLICSIWQERDAGLWEVRSGPQHFTQSKIMCWVALDRALRMARAGRIPSRHAVRWQAEAAAIRDFVEERCWSDSKGSYVRHPGTEELDASLLLARALRLCGSG